MRRTHSKPGVTLVELMVAMAMISIGVLGMIGSYKYINLGIQSAKTRSLANNIAQERIEFIKNKSYYRVLVTTATDTDTNFDPEMVYDTAPNGSETVNVGGIEFIRRIYIRKVNENSSGDLAYLSWNDPDTGIKEVKVYVVWFERGEWRKLELRNLRENPARVNQSAKISGNVKSGGNDLEGVMVRAQESPSNYGETDDDGNYTFTIEPGTYTLLASKNGYFSKTLPKFGLGSGAAVTGKDFSLNQMASGSITGSVWLRDHLAISMVVGSSENSSGFDQEWIELYNPTTWTWTMATGLNSGVIGLGYKLRNQASPLMLELDYNTLALPPQGYYLVANTNSVSAGGTTRSADAVYRNTNPGYPNIIKIDSDPGNDAASVSLVDLSSMKGLDVLGWKTGGLIDTAEGNPLNESIGLQLNEQYVRRTQAGAVTPGVGRAYDSNDNASDFSVVSPIAYGPRNSSDLEAPVSGTPAAGALVFADDSLSSPGSANAAGAFSLLSVATGTYWTVYASSGVAFSSVTVAVGTAGGYTASTGEIFITTTTSYGYISGRVTSVAGGALPGIKMFSPGMPQVPTGADGRYTLPVAAGMVNVTANYMGQSPTYVELSSADVNVEVGLIVKDVDFALYNGGKIRGRITSNGTDPLPNIPVVGLKGGVEQGSGISDDQGYFLISGSGISTGTYSVVPQLETGESSSPSSTTVTVLPGVTTYSSTFTVSGASGYFTGTVHTGSAAGPVITTGVLLYITTATISGDPPPINSAVRDGNSVYYAGSSNARGEFSIAVKGGFSYNIYAWYTTWTGSTPFPAKKYSTGVSINPNETKSLTFFW